MDEFGSGYADLPSSRDNRESVTTDAIGDYGDEGPVYQNQAYHGSSGTVDPPGGPHQDPPEDVAVRLTTTVAADLVTGLRNHVKAYSQVPVNVEVRNDEGEWMPR